MGTRADFYIKSGPELVASDWLGSVAMDGYPDGIDEAVLAAETADDFRAALADFFASRDDYTAPERGWPWPWESSDTSDYAYVFIPDVGVVHQEGGYGDPVRFVRSLGIVKPAFEWVADDEYGHSLNASLPDVSYTHPDMSALKRVTFGTRSGLIVLGGAQ